MARDERMMELLERFAAARARGESPDAGALLDEAGDDAPRLAELMEGYLQAAPGRPADPAVVDRFQAMIDDEPPLVALRHRRALTVDAVTDRLVADLGLAPAARPRVRALYQQLERGLIDMHSVAGRLRAALSSLLGVPEQGLAGTAPSPAAVVFARAQGDLERALGAPPHEPLPGPELPEVDALFGRA